MPAPFSRPTQGWAACSVTASPAIACRATSSTPRSSASWTWAVEVQAQHPRRQGRHRRAAGEGLRRHPLGHRLPERPRPAGARLGRTPNCVSGVAFLKAFNEGRMKVTADKVVVRRRRRHLHRRGVGGAPSRPHQPRPAPAICPRPWSATATSPTTRPSPRRPRAPRSR